MNHVKENNYCLRGLLHTNKLSKVVPVFEKNISEEMKVGVEELLVLSGYNGL